MRTTRITDWSTRRDGVGRLIGTYRRSVEVAWTAGPTAGTTWSETYDLELRAVVRVPW